MSLDQLLQASLPPKMEESKPVSPTLMIGVGGTGKEVLLRLRRRIVERYGSLSMLPFLQFMHLDTDTTAAAHEQYDLRGSDDPLHQEVRFKPIERVDLTIDGGTGKYIEHINNFPQIKRWFPTGGKIAGLGNLGEGAGQVRMASRLGFFHAPNFSRIAGRLEQCKGLLRDAAILQRSSRLGFEFDPQGMNIFVIASLAGGTGSGTFLDIAFLLQRYFPNAERVGILLLPGFFTDYAGGERVRANGYAALTELNHYSFGHAFLADWDGGRSENLPPPPFSTTYLIDGLNEAGLVIGSSGKEYDAYRMISEVLFQDYSIGKFAGMKRATRVNLVNFNLNVYTHNFLNEALRKGNRESHKNIVGDTYPTRFGSFGLATISFPTDRVQSACASRLAVQILDFWQKSLLEDPLDRLFTNFVSHDDVQFAQGRYERRDGGGVIERKDIETALMVYDSGGGKTFPSYLWQKAQSARSEVEAAPSGQKAHRLTENRQQMEQLLAKEDSENPEEWGVGIRQIESNMRLYIERVKSGIEKRAEELSNNPQYGVAYTLSMLRELKSLLRNENFWYVRYFEDQVPVWRDAVQYHSHALDQVGLDIARHEKQILFKADDLKRDFEKLVADDGADDLGAFYNCYLSRVRKQIARRGKKACEEIDRFLGPDDPTGDGLLGRFYSLLVGFEKLKDRLRAKERYFSKPEKSELILSLYREGDAEEWYRIWIGEPPQEVEALKLIGNQILTEIFQVSSVTAALAYIQQTPTDEVEARVLEHCRKLLASKEKQPEALAMLTDGSRIRAKQREEIVRQTYRLSKVWLARGERGLEHTGLPPVRPDQRPCLIGVDISNAPRLEEFKALVREIQTPGDTPPSFQNIGEQNRGMIVFYNELAGVPAFYPSSVTAPRGLSAAYDVYPDKEDLHTDKNRFQFGDLIPKQTEEARQYADSLRAFVLARLLGLLRVREIEGDSEHLTFHYSYKRIDGLSVEDVVLGDEQHAVDYLYRDKRAEHLTDRRILLRMADETIQTLRKHRMLWVYALLLEFYLKKIYPPTEMTVLGIANLTATQYSPEYAVLDVARVQLPQVVADKSEQEQLRNALELHRRRPMTEELAYEEYRAALSPFCKTAGKFPEQSSTSVVLDQTEWLDVLALDLGRIDKSIERDRIKPPPQTAAQTAAKPPEKSVGDRPCPTCGKPIDRRAIYCVHCKQAIAEHVTCPHCQEPRVPSDLESCWKCGLMMRDEEKMECPRCFGFSGFENDFPCPFCGYDPKAGPETVIPVSIGAFTSPAGLTGNGGPPPVPQPAPEPASAPVQCPTCYSMVAAGPLCSVCSGALPAS
jgi:Tubulin like/Double zinc ribbon